MSRAQSVEVTAGYARPWVVRPGDLVSLHASLPRATRIDLVRLACLNAERDELGRPCGPTQRILPLACEERSGLRGPAPQPLVSGAGVDVQCSDLPDWTEASLVLAVQRLARGAPGRVLSLLDDAGQGLAIDVATGSARSARLTISLIGAEQALDVALPGNDWLVLVLDALPDESRGLRVRTAACRATVPDGMPSRWTDLRLPWLALKRGAPVRLQMGTVPGLATSADVRVDLVSIVPRALVEALSPAQVLACEGATDAPPARSSWESRALAIRERICLLRSRLGTARSAEDLAGRAVITEGQRPYAAVRGVRWTGAFQSPHAAPAHYSALHLHADTLLDAGWPASFDWTVPADADSGVYAFRMQAANETEPIYASFFVSGAARPRHKLAVLLPTFTYLAYANAPEDMRGPRVTEASHVAEDRLDAIHPAHGRSIYERHRDGLSVLWAGSRRPLWSVSPGHRPWGLVADSWLLDWLEDQGQPFDVITDHDLHRMGAAALAPYRTVITGHHPEYYSTSMWDGMWRYLNGGGRLLYLGGNGFYWRTAWDETLEAIEVRRAEDGTRPSIGTPGEYTCAFSGEYGGIWRRLGRPPQQLVGVGMAAQGFERAAHYRKLPDASAPETAFVFEGVESDTFGRSGWWGGGASGWEIDRSDPDLGTPSGAWWLARSEDHAQSMLRTKEELLSYILPFPDSKARSDVVLAPIGRGDVFAVGSMTWIGSLHTATGASSDVARMTANVIRRFLDPAPIARKSEQE